MDKRKLVNIIVKDLAEIKLLAEEVAESQDDSSLIIHLALNRARLLCQEIELLQELTEKNAPLQQEQKETGYPTEEEEEEVTSDLPYSDPELEILNFEERDFSVSDESYETEEEADETDEEEEDDLTVEEDLTQDVGEEDLEEEDEDLAEEEEEDLEDEDDLAEEDDESQEEVLEDEEEVLEDEEEVLEDEEGDLEEEEEDLEEEEEEELTEEPEEELEKKAEIHHTELKNDLPPGMREIHIDDQEDEYEIGPLRSAPMAGSPLRPPMREIPKPEVTEPVKPEKLVVGEKYQKERSLNDTIGENQSMESKLTNNRITSLRAAIGLNDRFQFIREIFGNNSEKYNTVIEKLDKMETIQEAVEYLKANLTMEKNEASMKFVELLKRRFPK